VQGCIAEKLEEIGYVAYDSQTSEGCEAYLLLHEYQDKQYFSFELTCADLVNIVFVDCEGNLLCEDRNDEACIQFYAGKIDIDIVGVMP